MVALLVLVFLIVAVCGYWSDLQRRSCASAPASSSPGRTSTCCWCSATTSCRSSSRSAGSTCSTSATPSSASCRPVPASRGTQFRQRQLGRRGRDALRTGLNGLYAVAERYPDLKANEAFHQLQTRISGLETAIADGRRSTTTPSTRTTSTSRRCRTCSWRVSATSRRRSCCTSTPSRRPTST